jgi:hypothetical protein
MSNLTNIELVNYFERLPSFSDKRFFLLSLPCHLKMIFWFTLTTSLIVGSIAKIAMYSHILNSRIKEQPINVLIFIEQVIHHICNFFVLFSICISYPHGMAPGEFVEMAFGKMFGREIFCEVFFNAHALNVTLLAASGLGIALIRLLYIKNGTWLKYTFGEIKFLALTGLGIAVAALTLMCMFSSANKLKRSPYLLCMGHNQEFQVLKIYL